MAGDSMFTCCSAMISAKKTYFFCVSARYRRLVPNFVYGDGKDCAYDIFHLARWVRLRRSLGYSILQIGELRRIDSLKRRIEP